jgi:enhancer of mRNA-decapping protein 4
MKCVEKAAEQAVQRALAVDGKFEKKFEIKAKESAEFATKQAVAAMQAPIVSTLHQVMREVMIPAYESATRQMFYQISSSVEIGLAKRFESEDSSSTSLQAGLMQMSVAIQALSKEVAELRGEVKAGGKANVAAHQTQQTQTTDIRTEILALCRSNRYEEAFTKAVSASDGEVVLFACKNADSSAVFGGNSVAISQPILICLMQQLGTILVSTTDAADFKILLAWLQEVAVTIDPTDASIQRHVNTVIQQLMANINSKMATCDPAFRRPLQTLMQVIRGLAV